jgi:hypothetical protein
MKIYSNSIKLSAKKITLFIAFLLIHRIALFAQINDTAKSLVDTTQPSTPKTRPSSIASTDTIPAKKDSVVKKKHSPRTAAIRSAIFPGLGQIYNKKYWKLPIVYAAMGISGGIFLYNLKNYHDTRFAYTVKYNMRVFGTDTALYDKIKAQLKPLSEESLRFYRNQFRRDIDFSAVFFIIMWGLNIVDAVVDAHLKSFDVSPNLSLNLKPGYSEMAGTNGLSLVVIFGKKKML